MVGSIRIKLGKNERHEIGSLEVTGSTAVSSTIFFQEPFQQLNNKNHSASRSPSIVLNSQWIIPLQHPFERQKFNSRLFAILIKSH